MTHLWVKIYSEVLLLLILFLDKILKMDMSFTYFKWNLVTSVDHEQKTSANLSGNIKTKLGTFLHYCVQNFLNSSFEYMEFMYSDPLLVLTLFKLLRSTRMMAFVLNILSNLWLKV